MASHARASAWPIPVTDSVRLLRGVQFRGLFPGKPSELKNCFRVFAPLRQAAVTHPSSLLIAMALIGLMVVEIATHLNATA
jgi:hypothetical protein